MFKVMKIIEMYNFNEIEEFRNNLRTVFFSSKTNWVYKAFVIFSISQTDTNNIYQKEIFNSALG